MRTSIRTATDGDVIVMSNGEKTVYSFDRGVVIANGHPLCDDVGLVQRIGNSAALLDYVRSLHRRYRRRERERAY
ncbi:hypothetical protein ACQR1I_35480 [Bradyrhizobium sp. HKCCYLS2038]|uniref:hypothetical protein n=1 Tax=unclassified Bradyrhizobium TaxID=2631580 RepID=UPI003EC05EB0